MNKHFLVAVVSCSIPFAPAWAQDTVRVRDRSTRPERIGAVAGTITSESISGIKIKPTVGAERELPAADVVDVIYQVPGAVNLDYKRAVASEEKRANSEAGRKALQEAEADYRKVLNNLKRDEKTLKVQRHLEFKIAQIRGILAGENKEQLLEVAALLEKFRKDYPDSWQTLAVARQLAQLRIDADKFADAVNVYDDLAKSATLPKDVKQEFELAAIDVLMRARDYGAAQKRIDDALRTSPPADPQAGRLKILQIGCQASKADLAIVEPKLKDAIEKSPDPLVRALAYNTLGDCYNAKGQKKDAMWAYLWVDVVYNQDKGEHLKAIERLAGVFKDLNDDERALKYKEKLARLR